MYPEARLIIGGVQSPTGSAGTLEVTNPADDTVLGMLPKAGASEAAEAARLSREGFEQWSAIPAFERSKVLRGAAQNMRDVVEQAALTMTLEQGKPIGQARLEWLASADLLDWYAEEGRRAYGRIVPSRVPDIALSVLRRPVGPVAAFAPWNFPAWGLMQKIAPALGAGCSVVAKPSEATPATAWLIGKALLEAGLPPKAISVVWGNAAELSEVLVRSNEIRKVSLTGSIRIGRIVAALAGEHLKKVTMELGGHAPVIVAADADLDRLVPQAVQWKFRNAGQVCVSPTRFLVQESVHDDFVEAFARQASALKLGPGSDEATQMGPLCTRNQRNVVSGLVEEARAAGARVETGGDAIGNAGNFYAPTILSGMTPAMRAMNDEPFGPLALVMKVNSIDEALEEANRMPVGLGSYAFTESQATAARITRGMKAGMLGLNHFALALPETPFGGVLDSGFGSEGGSEGLDAYLSAMLVTSRA